MTVQELLSVLTAPAICRRGKSAMKRIAERYREAHADQAPPGSDYSGE